MPRTPEELNQALEEQLQALRSSCRSYDDGQKWEAKRIATTLVTLFHSRGKTKALLEQMDLLNGLELITSAEPNPPGNLMTWTPLVFMRSTGECLPHLSDPIPGFKKIPFQQWWEESVYEDGNLKLSRSLLLRTLRDQEGGSHYDSEVSDDAYKLMKNGAGWYIRLADGTEHPFGDVELATARQIAYEAEQSLKDLMGG